MSNDDQKTAKYVAAALRTIMHRRGLTQKALADLAELSQPLISRILRLDVKSISDSTLRSLAKGLQVSPQQLIAAGVQAPKSTIANVKGFGDIDVNYYRQVIVLNCGGTITMLGSKSIRPDISSSLNLRECLIGNEYDNVRIEDVFKRPPDSSNIGSKEWTKITEAVRACNKKKLEIYDQLLKAGIKIEKGGIVITHGTDTLHFTSLFVALELSTDTLHVPVIFTGSHSPIDREISDGPKNLKKSVFAAKERFSMGKNNLMPGVYVLVGKDIHLASRITKVRTEPDSDGRYFFSFPAPIATITGLPDCQVKVDDTYVKWISSQTNRPDFEYLRRKELGMVEHVVFNNLTSIEIMHDLIRRFYTYKADPNLCNCRMGLVVQGNFSKNPDFWEIAQIMRDQKDMPIMLGSKHVYTKIQSEYHAKNIFLIHKSMSHTKAQVKLRWLLGFDLDLSEIGEFMRANLAGEVFETEKLPEWINYETFPENLPGTEVVTVYPDINERVIESSKQRLMRNNSERTLLYIFGFGDGHIPTVNRSILSIVNSFISDQRLPMSLLQDIEGDVYTLADYFGTCLQNNAAKENLKAYLTINYDINKARLNSAMRSATSEIIRENEQKRLVKLAIEVVDRYSDEAKLRNISEVKQAILKSAKFAIRPEDVENCLPYSPKELIEANDSMMYDWLIENYPLLLAKRIMKDSLMATNKIMFEIGDSVDRGIRVFVRSLAMKSRSNTLLYETGNMLMVLGADSDVQEGWKTDYMLRRPKA